MLIMQRIPVPEWARPFAVTIDADFGDQEFERFSAHRSEIWEIVQNAVDQFATDDELTSNGELHFFPERQRLTGEYYIAGEDYHVNQAQDPRRSAERKLILSVRVSCLEKQWIENQTDFDYLGLELFFIWDALKQNFSYTGDIEPRVI